MCPRCGTKMDGGVCPECGFPVTKWLDLIYKRQKTSKTSKHTKL